MTPEEDSTWVRCNEHFEVHWCDWTRQYLMENKDADSIPNGINICIPIVPLFDLYADVIISDEIIPDLCYSMYLVMPEPVLFGNLDPELKEMGLWNKGEGRLMIAATLQDWKRSVIPPRCESRSHGFEQEIFYQKYSGDPLIASANEWCLAYYGHCWACHSIKNIPSTQSNAPSFDASSFGVNPSEFRGNRASTASQARTRQALQDFRRNRA